MDCLAKCCEFGPNLKNASPFRYTMIHSLAPGAGERLIESATHLLIKLNNDGRGEVKANLAAAAQGDPS